MLNFNPERTLLVGEESGVTAPARAPDNFSASVEEISAVAPTGPSKNGVSSDLARPSSFGRLRFDDSLLRRNQRSIADHMDDAYYTVHVSPSMMKTTAPVIGFTERYEYATFTAASSADRLNINWPIPALWVSGNLEATYFYSGSVGSTAAIRWNWLACSQPLAGDINATVDLNTSIDAPGPAAANTIARVTFTSHLTIGPADVLLGLRVLREGAHANDTYAGDAYWLGATFRFIPALQTVDTKGRLKR